MKNNKIFKDTVFLTCMEFVMEGMSLFVNSFITRELGTEAIGIISLIGSFFIFAAVISSGNVFLSASRFISEEIGKRNGSPDRVFSYALRSSLVLSIFSGLCVFFLSDTISISILHTPKLSAAVKILAAILPVSAVNVSLKGCFTAYRSVYLPSVSGILEFICRSSLLAFFIETSVKSGELDIYSAFALSTALGQAAGCIFMAAAYFKKHRASKGKCSISFVKYILSSVPIFLNSLVTSVLSSANDALVPITLKQYGSSTSQAFGQFGIFEGIVIPALFFPSSILCSLSSILVPELARERGADNSEKNSLLVKNVMRKTFCFSVFTAIFFLRFGDEIGFLMSGGHFAGKIIAILSPAVPFIYLEIILEGILKGMGRHTFSSINYLAEYTIRISVLLVTVPVIGFYGIVASYLASNIICNISRLVMILKLTGLRFDLTGNIIIPAVSGLLAYESAGIIEKLLRRDSSSILLWTVFLSILMLMIYLLLLKIAENRKIFQPNT